MFNAILNAFLIKLENLTYCYLPSDSRAAYHVDLLIPVFRKKQLNC